LRSGASGFEDSGVTVRDVGKMGERIYESYATHLLKSESELEKAFWLRAAKTHGTFDRVDSQKQIGPYRVDSYFEINGQRLAIELDGAAYHEATRDNERDSFILRNGLVDQIIRIPFAAMFHYRDATFAVLERWVPEFASEMPIHCIPYKAFLDELNKASQEIGSYGRYSDFFSVNEFIEWADGFYEVFNAGILYGFACSVKSARCIGLETSKLKFINRKKLQFTEEELTLRGEE
jgi:very-short-patch-repair endonuclease